MRKTIALLLAIIIILVGIVICSVFLPRIDTGTVIAKNYEPARSWTQYIHAGRDVQAVPHYEPEQWTIQVQGDSDEGKRVTEWWYVDEATYHKVEIGDLVQRG